MKVSSVKNNDMPVYIHIYDSIYDKFEIKKDNGTGTIICINLKWRKNKIQRKWQNIEKRRTINEKKIFPKVQNYQLYI